jgi:predicted MPP superfamily phosphohydrolase
MPDSTAPAVKVRFRPDLREWLPRGRTVVLMAIVWAVLVAVSVWLHRAAWLSPNPPVIVIGLTGMLHVIEAPGWAALRFFTGGWGGGLWKTPAMVAGMSWAFWFVAAWMLWEIRAGAHLLLKSRPAGAPKSQTAPDPSRRRFLVDAPLAAAVFVPTGAVVKSTLVDPWRLALRRYTVPIRGLPPALDGVRLAQLSDTHLGPRVPAAFLRRAVTTALDLKPDVFLLTGDYIMSGAMRIGPAAELFRPLIATGRPVIGVLGNHDWYGNGPAMSAALTAIGVRMIDNGRVFLDAGTRTIGDAPGAQTLCIAGVGDYLTDKVDVHAAIGNLPADLPRLLVSHNPDVAELPVFLGRGAPRVDLMISGHTHGGQVMLPFIGAPMVPSRYGQKYLGGVVQGPAFPVLISRGVGMSILPLRFGVPPEVVEITLTRA